MKKILPILLLLTSILISAQEPKHEFRATWLTTVWSIDWPGTKITTTGSASQIKIQKDGLDRILDSLKSCNMNVACFQIRSRCDAMYPSSYEPWSSDLVATRGMDPGYDPLAYAIEAAHKRGIELHVWLNPYRYATSNSGWGTGSDKNHEVNHPDWIIDYPGSNMQILDPANPEVLLLIKSIVEEVVNNYDVDGVIFDDYFYAYGGTTTQDAASVAKFKPAGKDTEDWRRENVNKMIAAVYETIQSIKPYVRFGVSPFGIWTTDSSVAAKEGITLPSGITGSDMYKQIYCDPVAWLKEGTVDYISPQLYWKMGGSQDYNTLAPWWSDLSFRFGKHFYSSMSTSSFASSLTEINGQTSAHRTASRDLAPGNIYYNTNSWYLKKDFTNNLRTNLNKNKVLLPAINWKYTKYLGLVQDLTLNSSTLSWTELESGIKYAVYAIPETEVNKVGNFQTSQYLIDISYSNSYEIPTKYSNGYSFAVAAVDRYGNEYAAKLLNIAESAPATVSITYPADNSTQMFPITIEWTSSDDVEYYYCDIAKDNEFKDIVSVREVNEKSLNTANLSPIEDGTYYIRVRARKTNAPDAFSQIIATNSVNFKITSPSDLTTNTTLTPTIEWSNIGGIEATLEIATANSFNANNMVFSDVTTANSMTVPEYTLTGLVTYYARVKTTINGNEVTTPIISFTTSAAIPEIPRIIFPLQGENIIDEKITIKWDNTVANGYTIHLSKTANFSVISLLAKSTNAYVCDVDYTGSSITAGTYYVRVRGKYSNNLTTDWSDVVSFNYTKATDIKTVDNIYNNIFVSTRNNVKYLNITSSISSDATIRLFNYLGQVVFTENIYIPVGESSIELPSNNMTKGIYVLQIQSNNKTNTIKLNY